MLRKMKLWTLRFVDLTHEGAGVTGSMAWVLWRMPCQGRSYHMRVLKVNKIRLQEKWRSTWEKSPHRNEELDLALARSGIADSLSEQLKFWAKTQVKDSLYKMAGISDISMTLWGWTTCSVPQPPRSMSAGRVETFRKNSHDLMPIEDFYIQDPVIDQEVINGSSGLIRRFDLQNARWKRQADPVLFARSYHSGEIMEIHFEVHSFTVWTQLIEQLIEAISSY